MRISLIGTIHEEGGAVTIAALLEILEEIGPEVVFAEIPLTHYHAWREGSHGTLESLAVARYAEAHSVEIVPVDLPKPKASFFQDHEEVARAIERTSPHFRQLVDLNSARVRQYGLSYLNSDACIQAWSEIYREELDTIEYIGNPRLTSIYARVREMNERRDLEMLEKIRTYCSSAAQTRGVFFVGAAHRKSLIEKIHDVGENTIPRIEWNFGVPPE